jgi:hypothetical protein
MINRILALAHSAVDVQRGLFRDCHGPAGVTLAPRVLFTLDRKRSRAGLLRDYRAVIRAKG